jgi:hypothetical protein
MHGTFPLPNRPARRLPAPRFSPPQLLAIYAIRRHGRLEQSSDGWAAPGGHFVCTTITAKALIAAGFCRVLQFRFLHLTPAYRRQLRQESAQ